MRTLCRILRIAGVKKRPPDLANFQRRNGSR
jgi:hypothetical protein